MRPRITHLTHPKAPVTTKATAALAVGCAGLLLALAGCGSPSPADGPSSSSTSSSASDGKNGDTPPKAQTRPQAQAGTARVPVPRGTGSRVPYDFNGDGHRDLVIDDLVKAPEDSHGDDAGIGIVPVCGDFDGDQKPDTVVRTYRGERQDLIALYPAGTTDEPVLTFSTALFLP